MSANQAIPRGSNVDVTPAHLLLPGDVYTFTGAKVVQAVVVGPIVLVAYERLDGTIVGQVYDRDADVVVARRQS